MTDKQRAAARNKVSTSTKSKSPQSTKSKMAGPPRLSTADRKTLESILAKGSGSGITDKERDKAQRLLRTKGIKK
jgi:hypothetical protein